MLRNNKQNLTKPDTISLAMETGGSWSIKRTLMNRFNLMKSENLKVVKCEPDQSVMLFTCPECDALRSIYRSFDVPNAPSASAALGMLIDSML